MGTTIPAGIHALELLPVASFVKSLSATWFPGPYTPGGPTAPRGARHPDDGLRFGPHLDRGDCDSPAVSVSASELNRGSAGVSSAGSP